MKSVIQNYKSGDLTVSETPVPQLRDGYVLVRNACSLISAGTEKTKVDTAKKSLVGKAMARPDLVKKLVAKARREGLWKAWQTASQRLDQPTPLGYSCAGQIIDVQGDVDGLCCGDWVACGGGSANHAEIVSVPRNLATIVPEGVGCDQAAFATIGAIAMQGVRQTELRLGERVAVIGLGLVGLMTVQLVKASGCRVLGIDVDPSKTYLAKELGCDEVVLASDNVEECVIVFSDGYGVDATIITAGTSSNGPIEQAGEITREKGRVIVVGATGLSVPREPYYMKEIDLRISRSYGPGRYDPRYEEEGIDYPFGYVRFTERRNMQCFLDLVKSGDMQLAKMITHRFSIDDAPKAYEIIGGQRREPYLGILLEYGRSDDGIPRRVETRPVSIGNDKIRVGVIGAGNYASANLLPHVRAHPLLQFSALCTGSGLSSAQTAKRFGFNAAESSPEQVIQESDAVVVATRHNDHAQYAIKSLQMGKPVFVEKPLAICDDELESIVGAVREAKNSSVTVGFNRRFSPAATIVKGHFDSVRVPKQLLIRVNAGAIPPDHWIQNPKVGGGRLIGEGCHFVDLAVALLGETIERVHAVGVRKPGLAHSLWDDFSILLTMRGGSIATIVYTAIGDSGLPKERIELSGGGKSAVINDFESADLWSHGKKTRKTWDGMDKGQKSQISAWAEGLRSGRSSIAFDEIVNVHRACFAAVRSFVERQPVQVS